MRPTVPLAASVKYSVVSSARMYIATPIVARSTVVAPASS
jgi:hypothetical protein